MLEISDQNFFETKINILTALMEKVDNMQEQMGYINTEMEIQRKNQKRMLDVKNLQQKFKNAFYGLISRLDTAEDFLSLRM